MKFTIIKSCLARFSGIFAVGTPSNIHGTAISYRCAKFGAFVNSVTILTLRDLTISGWTVTGHLIVYDRKISAFYSTLLLLLSPLSLSQTENEKSTTLLECQCM